MRSLIVFSALLALSLTAIAQTPTKYFLAVGGGYSEDAGMTGTFGRSATENGYTTISADVHASLNPTTGKRFLYTTFRPGYHYALAHSGPFTLLVSGDIGAQFGGEKVVGTGSTGGTLLYDVPKHPNLALYATYRAYTLPQESTVDSRVHTSLGFGIVLKFQQ